MLNPYNYPEFNTLKLKLDAAVESPRIPLNDYRLPNDGGDEIANSIRNGDARVVTDGSFKDKKGTAAVKVYAGTRTTNCITAVAWAPGQAHEQSAYRSELTGIDCALTIIKALVDQHEIHSGENNKHDRRYHQGSFDLTQEGGRTVQVVDAHILTRDLAQRSLAKPTLSSGAGRGCPSSPSSSCRAGRWSGTSGSP